MIQEYLLISDEFKTEIENLALPEGVSREIESIENSSCWTFRLSTTSNDEKAAALLSNTSAGFSEKYNATLLSDECSAYFNRRLYPIVNEFERKLRKLLYLASALKEDETAKKAINNLESKNLDTIFSVLFFDPQYIKNVKEKVNHINTPTRQEDLLNEIKGIDESILWETLLGKDCAPLLQKHHKELRGYRNDVMHAHNINISEYREARRLFDKVNKEIDDAIGEIIGSKEDNNIETIPANFNDALINALEKVQELTEGIDISPMVNALSIFVDALNGSIGPQK